MTQHADRIAASTPAQARKVAAQLSTDELHNVDIELGVRAARLGRVGAVSKPHAALRAALRAALAAR